jgi:hypothetical protein
MSAPAVKGPWFDVPAGTRAAECRTCHATVFWITTANDRKMPVDCEVDGGMQPSRNAGGRGAVDGRGVSHFATCPYANAHRRPR